MKRFSIIQLTVSLALIFALGSGNVFGQTCPSGMISYWKLQEASGPSYADSYGSLDGFAPVSAPSAIQGISGNAQSFNKLTSTYITVPDDAALDWGGGTSFSIEFWVKIAGASAQNMVFIGRDESSSLMQWWIGSTVTGKITWYLGASDGSNGSVTTDASFNNGSWHHVVAARDGSLQRNFLYVDGVLQNVGGTSVILGGSLSSGSPVSFGALLYNGNPDYFLTGALDEVAFYNRALDPNADILPHYNNLRLYQIGYCDGDAAKFISTPVIEAQVGQLYYYDVDASGNSLPTYELIEGPTGMNINTTTGEITWTPSSISQNGHVKVQATNDKGSVMQEFNVFIADSPNCRSNLIAYWDFNDSDAAPYFDNISNFKLTGIGPVPVPGVVGNALLFDGVNDSLNMHDDFSPNRVFFDFDDVPSWSMEVWVKSSASPAQTMVIVGRDQVGLNTQYWLGINPNGTVGFFLRDWPDTPQQQYLEGGNVLDGNWHHIVGSYSESAHTVHLYVDKILVDAASENFYNFGGNADLNIGCLNTTSNKYWFNGAMDELAFYNQQLSAARVSENYTNGISGLGACVYNHAPVISSKPDSTVLQDDNYNYAVVVEELDPLDVITISAPSKPEWLSFSFVPGNMTATLSGIPDNLDVGMHNVTIRVSDGKVNVDQSFTIRVMNVNDDPVITSTPSVLEIDQGESYSYTVEATDSDGDDLIYSAPQKPASFSFDPNTHVLSGIPTNDDVGLVDITVRVFDGTTSVDQQFQITVNDVNDAPVISSNPALEVFQGEDYTYTIIATDPDGDDLTYSAPQIPAWMTFDVNSHRLSGMTEDFEGVVDITLRVSDGTVEVDQVYQLNVKNVNDLPVITTEPSTLAYVDEAYLYQMEATDADAGDVLTFTAPSLPSWLSFIAASNSALLSGTPTEADLGSHTVIIKVSDGQGEVIQAYSINVVLTSVELENSLVKNMYPNPVVNEVHFDMSSVGNIELFIYDIKGEVLKTFSQKNSDHIKVDISDLPSNLYFYKISLNDEITVGKLVKE